MTQKGISELKKAAFNRKTKDQLKRLRVISGSGRYRILLLLNEMPEGLRVTEIAEVLHASTSRVSHQMRILRKNGMVVAEPRGREKTYVSKIQSDGLFV